MCAPATPDPATPDSGSKPGEAPNGWWRLIWDVPPRWRPAAPLSPAEILNPQMQIASLVFQAAEFWGGHLLYSDRPPVTGTG